MTNTLKIQNDKFALQDTDYNAITAKDGATTPQSVDISAKLADVRSFTLNGTDLELNAELNNSPTTINATLTVTVKADGIQFSSSTFTVQDANALDSAEKLVNKALESVSVHAPAAAKILQLKTEKANSEQKATTLETTAKNAVELAKSVLAADNTKLKTFEFKTDNTGAPATNLKTDTGKTFRFDGTDNQIKFDNVPITDKSAFTITGFEDKSTEITALEGEKAALEAQKANLLNALNKLQSEINSKNDIVEFDFGGTDFKTAGTFTLDSSHKVLFNSTPLSNNPTLTFTGQQQQANNTGTPKSEVIKLLNATAEKILAAGGTLAVNGKQYASNKEFVVNNDKIQIDSTDVEIDQIITALQTTFTDLNQKLTTEENNLKAKINEAGAALAAQINARINNAKETKHNNQEVESVAWVNEDQKLTVTYKAPAATTENTSPAAAAPAPAKIDASEAASITYTPKVQPAVAPTSTITLDAAAELGKHLEAFTLKIGDSNSKDVEIKSIKKGTEGDEAGKILITYKKEGATGTDTMTINPAEITGTKQGTGVNALILRFNPKDMKTTTPAPQPTKQGHGNLTVFLGAPFIALTIFILTAGTVATINPRLLHDLVSRTNNLGKKFLGSKAVTTPMITM